MEIYNYVSDCFPDLLGMVRVCLLLAVGLLVVGLASANPLRRRREADGE